MRTKLTGELKELLAQVNEQIEEYEKVGFIVVAKDEWTIEEGLLTPTMKIKRSAIEDRYKPNLETWYDSGEKVIWE